VNTHNIISTVSFFFPSNNAWELHIIILKWVKSVLKTPEGDDKEKKPSPTTCSSLTTFYGFVTWLCTLQALLLPILQSNVSAPYPTLQATCAPLPLAGTTKLTLSVSTRGDQKTRQGASMAMPCYHRLAAFSSSMAGPYTGGIVILKNYQLLTLPLTARPGRHRILNKDKMLTSLQCDSNSKQVRILNISGAQANLGDHKKIEHHITIHIDGSQSHNT
jgi:hypothetical protein